VQRRCWYCNQPLGRFDLFGQGLFCSIEHEELYFSEQSAIAFERLKETTFAPAPVTPEVQEKPVEAPEQPAPDPQYPPLSPLVSSLESPPPPPPVASFLHIRIEPLEGVCRPLLSEYALTRLAGPVEPQRVTPRKELLPPLASMIRLEWKVRQFESPDMVISTCEPGGFLEDSVFVYRTMLPWSQPERLVHAAGTNPRLAEHLSSRRPAADNADDIEVALHFKPGWAIAGAAQPRADRLAFAMPAMLRLGHPMVYSSLRVRRSELVISFAPQASPPGLALRVPAVGVRAWARLGRTMPLERLHPQDCFVSIVAATLSTKLPRRSSIAFPRTSADHPTALVRGCPRELLWPVSDLKLLSVWAATSSNEHVPSLSSLAPIPASPRSIAGSFAADTLCLRAVAYYFRPGRPRETPHLAAAPRSLEAVERTLWPRKPLILAGLSEPRPVRSGPHSTVGLVPAEATNAAGFRRRGGRILLKARRKETLGFAD
jgi:hypothetical protein